MVEYDYMYEPLQLHWGIQLRSNLTFNDTQFHCAVVAVVVEGSRVPCRSICCALSASTRIKQARRSQWCL